MSDKLTILRKYMKRLDIGLAALMVGYQHVMAYQHVVSDTHITYGADTYVALERHIVADSNLWSIVARRDALQMQPRL